MSGCSDSGAPPAPVPVPPRPAQAAAKPAAPAPPPAPATAPYAYETKGRRDPFRPLIRPRVETAKARPKTGLAALDVKELKLAGIIWGGRGYYALVEAPNGAGYVVRLNDTVGEDARVAKITSDAVMFEVRTSPVPQSQARQVELRLRKEE
jgi:Tfp pilus assembly protein PilP